MEARVIDEKCLKEIEAAIDQPNHPLINKAVLRELIRLSRLGLWTEKHRTEIQYALTAAYNDDCDRALLELGEIIK